MLLVKQKRTLLYKQETGLLFRANGTCYKYVNLQEIKRKSRNTTTMKN